MAASRPAPPQFPKYRVRSSGVRAARAAVRRCGPTRHHREISGAAGAAVWYRGHSETRAGDSRPLLFGDYLVVASSDIKLAAGDSST